MICLINMVVQKGRLAAARVVIPADLRNEVCATEISRRARLVGMAVAVLVVRGGRSNFGPGAEAHQIDASGHGVGSVRAIKIQLLWGPPIACGAEAAGRNQGKRATQPPSVG